MFKKNRRFSKFLVVFLIFTLVFSFNSVFAGVAHTCTYPDALAGKTISDSGSIAGNDNGILPVLGVGGNKIQFPGVGVVVNSEASGPPVTSVRVTFTTGTEAHFEVVSGAVRQINVKTANNYKILTFSPSMQAGDCVILSTDGLGTSASGNLKEFSHITWYVGTEIKGSIEIQKVYSPELTQEETLPIATFALYKSDKTTVVDGQANIQIVGETGATGYRIENLALGSYYLKETSIPTGYALDSVVVGSTTLTADSNGFYGPIALTSSANVVVTATNAKLGSISIEKSYSDESSTAIATFQLWTFDGTQYDEYGSEFSITGCDSKTISDLPPNTYYLTETTNPPIYTLGASIDSLALDNSTGYYGPITVAAGASVTVNAVNTKVDMGSIRISKSYSPIASATGATATFQLYSDEAGTVPAIDAYGTQVAPITINGQSTSPVEIDNLLVGTYYLGEAGTPGYTLKVYLFGSSTAETANSYNMYAITVAKDEAVTVEAVNTKTTDQGTFKITKQWESESTPTNGYTAKFQVYTLDGTSYDEVGSLITLTGNPASFTSDLMDVGTYFLKEIDPPNGYGLAIQIDGRGVDPTNGYYRFEVEKESDGPSIEIVATNVEQYGDFAVEKVYSGTVYSGTVKFHIFDKDGNEITQFAFELSNKETKKFNYVPVGTYYITEEVPSGYTLTMNGLTLVNGKYQFEVNPRTYEGDNEQPVIVTYTATNSDNPPPPPPPGKVSIQLNKQYTSITTGTNPTAIFFLYSKNGTAYNEVAGPISITGAGTQTISNLDPGTYYLQESSMDGYALDSIMVNGTAVTAESGYYPIAATNAGTTVSVIALNSPPFTPPPPEAQEVDEELPTTGGNTIAYLLSGGVLTALGILVRRFQK